MNPDAEIVFPYWPVPTPTWEAEHADTLARIRQENHADDRSR